MSRYRENFVHESINGSIELSTYINNVMLLSNPNIFRLVRDSENGREALISPSSIDDPSGRFLGKCTGIESIVHEDVKYASLKFEGVDGNTFFVPYAFDRLGKALICDALYDRLFQDENCQINFGDENIGKPVVIAWRDYRDTRVLEVGTVELLKAETDQDQSRLIYSVPKGHGFMDENQREIRDLPLDRVDFIGSIYQYGI